MNDQIMTLTVAEEKVFSLIDNAVKKALRHEDMQVLVEQANMLRRQGQVSGLALAKLLYEWREHCDVFGLDLDDWADTVHAETGLSVQTARKYSTMWEVIFVKSRPSDDVLKRLSGQPIQSLLLMAPAFKEEQVSAKDVVRLSNAVDTQEVREIIHGIRGDQTSSNNALIIQVMRDGVLRAKRGDGAYVGIGYLNVNAREDPVVDAAISRLLRAAGVIEQ